MTEDGGRRTGGHLPTCRVGIDEAGYGPNLGPLVMTAVTAEGPPCQAFDLWAEFAPTIDRAGGGPDRLWVDDSKRVYLGAHGADRLEAAALCAIDATGGRQPTSLSAVLETVGAGTAFEVELATWMDGDPPVPRRDASTSVTRWRELAPFAGSAWRIAAVRSVVMGPTRFNSSLARHGNKARVHGEAFTALLGATCCRTRGPVAVCSDKHGGRNDYYRLLLESLPGCWIDRHEEGATSSRYVARDSDRAIEVCFAPRSDAADGLVALASIVSKYVRERWMEAFNSFWRAHLPGLQPTAGYPVDARRFRAAIEPVAQSLRLPAALWWRDR